MKDLTKIVTIEMLDVQQTKTNKKQTTNKTSKNSQQKKTKQNQNKQLLINDFGFLDKTLFACCYSLEIVTYWSQEIIFKILNLGHETYTRKLPIQLSKGFGPIVNYQCHGYHFLCR